MAGEGVKNAPSPTILCQVPCCHGRRIGQDRPGRLKLGSLVLPTALCKTHPRAPKSEAYFGCSGAPKLSPLPNFCYAAISCRMRFMCQKPAQFVGNGRLLNLFFGSGRSAHWSLSYGPFKLGGVGYVHVCACICRYMHVYECIYRYLQVYVGMYLETCGIQSIISLMLSAWLAQWYIVPIVHLMTGVRAPEQSKPFCCDLHLFC